MFSKKSFRNTIRVSVWVQTLWIGYQQTTKVAISINDVKLSKSTSNKHCNTTFFRRVVAEW